MGLPSHQLDFEYNGKKRLIKGTKSNIVDQVIYNNVPAELVEEPTTGALTGGGSKRYFIKYQ